MLLFAEVSVYVNGAICEHRGKQETVRFIQRDPGTESSEIWMSPRKETFLLLVKNSIIPS